MAKQKKEEKVGLLKYDPVETPEEIISEDKDTERKKAFLETYQRIAKIIPEYFMSQRKKRKNATSGGTSFTQNIVVTPDKVTLQTNELKQEEHQKEEEKEEREIGE